MFEALPTPDQISAGDTAGLIPIGDDALLTYEIDRIEDLA